MADDLTHDVNHYRTTSGYTENSLAFDANAVESSVVPSGLGKQQKLAEYIYQLFSNYHADNKADGLAIAKLYADLTFHRVYDMLNDFYKDIQGLSNNASPTSTDATDVKTKLDKVANDVKNLLSDTAPTLQLALKNALLLGQIKLVVDDILQNIVKTTNDKLDKILENVEDIKNAVSDETKSETQSKSTSTKKTSTANTERTLNYNKVDDKTLDVLNSAIATALAPVKKALASIQKATTANNGLLQYSTLVVKNIDNNLAAYANTSEIKAINRKIQITEFKSEDSKYRGALPQNPVLKKGAFKSAFDFGKALPQKIAHTLFILPFLGLFKVGSFGFGIIKKAFGVILSPLTFLVKGLGTVLSFILSPIKLILGFVTGIGSFIFGAFSFLFKGALTVLNGIFNLTSGIFKGVFKVISGIFSFIPKAIGGIFKVSFGLVKGIWNMSCGILKWTKTTILDRLKTPAGRNTIAFIAGLIYGFIIKPIKEVGFGKWLKTVGGAIYDGAIKVWDWARENVLNPLCNYVTTELWPKLRDWIVNTYTNWKPTTAVGKAVKGTIDWVIDLWSDETGPNMKGFFGKNGAFTAWVDSIKKWWEDLHKDGNFFGKGGTWEKLFGDGKTQGEVGKWFDKFIGKDGLLGTISKWMTDWFIGSEGKPGKLQQHYDKWFKDGGYVDGLKDAFSKDAAKRADAMNRGDWVSQIAKIYNWVDQNLIGPSVKFGQGIIDLLTGKISISLLVDESEAFKKIKTISLGVGGGLVGTKIGSLFGPWGALIGAAVGAGAGLIYDAIQNAENARKANFERLQQGKELLNEEQFTDADRKNLYKLYGSSYISPELNKSLDQRLLEHSSKIKELREKYEAYTTSNAEKLLLLPEIARATKLYELTFKAKNGLYDDLSKYEKDYTEVKNRNIGAYRKRGALEDVQAYNNLKESWQHFGYTSFGMGGVHYADIDKMTEDAAKKRIELMESSGENKVSRVNQIMEKLKQTGFYSRIGANSPDERRRLDLVLRNMIAGNAKFTKGEWRLFGDNDWEKAENLKAIEKEIQTLKDRKDGLFEKILGRSIPEELHKAEILATKEAAAREAYERGIKDGSAATAAGAAATANQWKVPSLGSSIIDTYSITK